MRNLSTILLFVLLSWTLAAQGRDYHVLLVVTSAEKIQINGQERTAGCWAEELIEPYQLFAGEGVQVTIASPLGGKILFDPASLDAATVGDETAVRYRNLIASDRMLGFALPLAHLLKQKKFPYDVVFFAGGHGAVVDLANNKEVQELLMRACQNGGILAAVCHGVAALLNLPEALTGAQVTGFSNREEDLIGMTPSIRRYLGDTLENLLRKAAVSAGQGAYVCKGEWQPCVVNYRNRVLSGQNPASSRPLAIEVLRVLDSLSNNRVKAMLQKDYPVYGAFVTIGHPSVVETLCLAGIDFIWIDAEHAALSLPQIVTMNMATGETGVVPIIRVPSNNMDVIKQHVDTGVMGVIVPYIKSKDDAVKAVRALKYPPQGERGIGLGRATRYFIKLKEYLPNANRDVMVILMIETKEVCDNIDEVLQVPGIDMLSIGPFDLSASCGYPGQTNHPEVRKAIEKVETAALKAGIPLGISVPDRKRALSLISRGYRFFVIGSDVEYLYKGARKFFEQE